jgi:hypothetical protein
MHRASGKPKDDQNIQYKKDPSSESDSDNDVSETRVRDEPDTDKVYVQEPMPYDVLCGRDRNYNKHPGNQVYQKLIKGHVSLYRTEIPKQEKMNITKSILSTMEERYGSRFIRRCCDTKNNPEPDDVSASVAPKRRRNNNSSRSSQRGNNSIYDNTTNAATWEVITHMAARDKISHALRCKKRANQSDDDGSEEEEEKPSHTIVPPSIFPDMHNIGTNETDSIDIGNHTGVGFSSPTDLGNVRNPSYTETGYYGMNSFDDCTISFDDSNTLLDIFGGGRGLSTPSVSASSINIETEISSPFDPWCETKPKGKRRRKGS